MLRNLAAQKEQQQTHQTPSNNTSISSYQSSTTLVNDSIYDKLRLLNNNHRHQSIRESCWPPRSPTSWYPHLPTTPHQQDSGNGNVPSDSANPLSSGLLSPASTPIKDYSSLSPNSCKTSSLNDDLAKTHSLSKKGEHFLHYSTLLNPCKENIKFYLFDFVGFHLSLRFMRFNGKILNFYYMVIIRLCDHDTINKRLSQFRHRLFGDKNI